MKSQAKRSDLKYFFEPASVAVFGSLKDSVGLGYGVIRNMLQFGYSGKIYPVSPSYSGEVLGFRAYSTVNDVAEPIDAAIVITPPPTVLGIIEQCARKGVKAAVIVSENFAEAGAEGARFQQQLVDIVHRTGIRIIGPNTIGIFNPASGFVTNPYLITQEKIRKGGIAYCSQTGYVGLAAKPLEDLALPVSKLCDIGNKCDVDESDVLNYLADDPETKVVAMHIENVKDGRRFMEAARRVVAHKPLLILKAGRSEAGAEAMASHTASLAGNERVYDAVIKQVGAIRLNSWEEYWEVPRVFAEQPLPRGNRIAIITGAGGLGVVVVDLAVESGLAVARFSSDTKKRLKKLSPRLGGNPIDLGPVLTVTEDPFSAQREIIEAVLEDENVDCAAVSVYAGFDALIPPITQMFDGLKPHESKPITVWIYGMTHQVLDEMLRQLESRNLPTYLDFELAVKSLGFAAQYSKIKLSQGA
jgi:acetate---CoA ligase (ADP-forming)